MCLSGRKLLPPPFQHIQLHLTTEVPADAYKHLPCFTRMTLKDLTANLMTEVCHDVCIEPTLQPLNGEVLSNATAISDDGASLILR